MIWSFYSKSSCSLTLRKGIIVPGLSRAAFLARSCASGSGLRKSLFRKRVFLGRCFLTLGHWADSRGDKDCRVANSTPFIPTGGASVGRRGRKLRKFMLYYSNSLYFRQIVGSPYNKVMWLRQNPSALNVKIGIRVFAVSAFRSS